jgi:hypothetical protein
VRLQHDSYRFYNFFIGYLASDFAAAEALFLHGCSCPQRHNQRAPHRADFGLDTVSGGHAGIRYFSAS